jgi:hypothetical protein
MERVPRMKLVRILIAWLAATIVTAASGSVIQTQFNLAAITTLGAPVPFALRLQTTLHDLAGFAPMLAGLTAAGFFVAFIVAALLTRFWPGRQALLYSLAGAAAVAAALLLMNAMLPVTVIGATRSLAGLIALVAAGALGGRVYAALVPGRDRRDMA